jgi:acyl transferase domain-containing protein
VNAQHDAIAIIGMAGRFPGARDVRTLWRNLCAGVESVQRLSEAELRAAGAPRELLAHPEHVPVAATAEGLDRFDAAFFGVSPREAELMDPQVRVALETVWEALEDAGVDPGRDGAGIGLFMGASLSSYLLHNLLPHSDMVERAGAERVLILNDKDFYPTTISYRLDLRGPSLNIGTACSSSLVSVHVACRSLLAGECTIAVAGGSSVHVPLGRGYLHTPGSIYAPDGHCRAFDASANGTVGADGAAFVVLKRQEDAVRDRHQIYAVVRGSAVNNDGAAKAGYTAPGVEGQSAVIAAALSRAAVRARDIGYVEAHGTGTILGDPIEVAALTDAFRNDTTDTGYCGLGALKANIGHLDAAAGVAGLIKAALIVRDGLLPPAVNFHEPNRHFDLARSPFFVNTSLRHWPEQTGARRAGVSALGVGGTNVHAIVEEPPAVERRVDAAVGPRIVPVSARTAADFERVTARLAEALDADQRLADIEFTLGSGRKQLPVRRAFVGATVEDLRAQLRGARGEPVPAARRRLLVLAPPRDETFESAGRELFACEPRFREAVLACVDAIGDARRAEVLRRAFDAKSGEGLGDATYLRAFVFQYAVVRMLSGWGIQPDHLIGLEIGELTATIVSGTLDLTEALRIAIRLDDEPPTARALLVKASHGSLASMLPVETSIAVVCAPDVSVIAGPAASLDRLRARFGQVGIACRPLKGAHWTGANSRTIRIDEVLQAAGREPGVWVELGAGRTLAGLVRYNRFDQVTCLPGLTTRPVTSALHRLLDWVAAAWEQGVEVRWRDFLAGRDGRVCSLPSYPFQSQRYWIDPPRRDDAPQPPPRTVAASGVVVPPKREDVSRWFYAPVWQPLAVPPPTGRLANQRWLLFSSDDRTAAPIEAAFRRAAREVIVVRRHARYLRLGAREYRVGTSDPADYDALFDSVLADGTIDGILHAATVRDVTDGATQIDRFEAEQADGLHSLLAAMQALGRRRVTDPLSLIVLANNTQEVVGGDLLRPEQSSLTAAAKVIPQEYPNVRCTHVDVDVRTLDAAAAERIVALIDSGLDDEAGEPFIACRGSRTLWLDYQQTALPPVERVPRLRERGVYLITGGLGGVGSTLAECLAREVRARLILVSRTPLPPRDAWPRLADAAGAEGEAIRRVRRIEAQGAEVLVEQADVCDASRMDSLIRSAEARFGPINGIIHAAALPDTAGVIQRRTREATERIMAAKVRGSLVLGALLRGRPLDFFVLCSSVATAVYGLKFGEVGYVAANDFLNGYGCFLRSRGVPAMSIAWTDWLEVGMSADAQQRARAREGVPALDALVLGMTPAEGIDVFRRALAADRANILVSTQDLHAMLAQQALVLHPARRDHQAGAFAEEQIEDRLRSIWRDLLGVEQIAADDDFFDLGGDSLVAVRMIARVKETFGVEQTLAAVLEEGTLRHMVDAIRMAASARLQPAH